MSASVCRPGEAPKQVKNLGWINKRSRDIFTVSVNENPLNQWDAVVEIKLRDRTKFTADFADRRVLEEWLCRKWWLDGMFIRWFGEVRRITRKGLVGVEASK